MQTLTRLYPTTALEDWISNLYVRLKILQPRQINEDYIAHVYNIFIHRKPIPSDHKVIGRYRGITIDTRKPNDIQREIFFHELCHILRHAGVQSMMPEAFRQLQEWDSRNFVRYAAIPHHMLKFVDLGDPYAVDIMTSMFKVTPELCEERLSGIKNRLAFYGKEYTS
jgi:hypothetical protein